MAVVTHTSLTLQNIYSYVRIYNSIKCISMAIRNRHAQIYSYGVVLPPYLDLIYRVSSGSEESLAYISFASFDLSMSQLYVARGSVTR